MRHAAFAVAPLVVLAACAPPRPVAEAPAAPVAVVASAAPVIPPAPPEPPAPAPEAADPEPPPSTVTPFDALPPLPRHPAGWRVRDCKTVEGFAQIALTFDGGRTLVESREAPGNDPTPVDSILPIEPKGTLVALTGSYLAGRPLYLSRDAGCRWQRLGTAPSFVFAYASGAAAAYAWTNDALFKVTAAGLEQLPFAPRAIITLAVDAKDADHVRAATRNGIFDSADGGRNWTSVAEVPARVDSRGGAITGTDLRTIVLSHADDGVPRVTRDGGATWSSSGGVKPSSDDSARVSILGFAEGGRSVWGQDGTGVYFSSDAAATFSFVAPAPHEPRELLRVLPQPNPRRLVTIGGRNELVTFDASTHTRTVRAVKLRYGGEIEITAGAATPGDAGGLVLGLGAPQGLTGAGR